MAQNTTIAEIPRNPVYEALREKLCALYRRDELDIHERVMQFHAALSSKYPDARKCMLFHLLSGSTPAEHYRIFDFPLPDSIESFILAEYARVFGE